MNIENLADQMKRVAEARHKQIVKEQSSSIMIVLLRQIRDAAENGKFSFEYGGQHIQDDSIRGAVRSHLIDDGFQVVWDHIKQVIIVSWSTPRTSASTRKQASGSPSIIE
jgi:hypothetical protein